MTDQEKTTERPAGSAPVTRRQAWLMAARPRTLPASVAPVFVGTALAWAYGHCVPYLALAALLIAVLLQVGANVANDYFDFVRGIDRPDRKGPTRVALSGLISLAELRVGMLAIFGLAALLGVLLVWAGGWPILSIGALSILGALAYSGGPYPLSTHGLGDLFAFLFFGWVAVGGAFYVQAGYFPPVLLLAATPVGLLVTAILVVNNVRDIETDRNVGKRTLAVIIGRQPTRWGYLLLLAGAYFTATYLGLAAGFSAWTLLPWLTLPLAAKLTRVIFTHTDGPSLNRALAGTAQLNLLFSLLLSLGIILGAL